jgi:methionyl-tRNA synthetase
MDAIEVRKAARNLRAIWVAGNEYLQSAAPWTAFKEDPDRAAAITRFALNLIPFYAGLSAPFIPDAAASMAEAMNTDLTWPDSAEAALTPCPPAMPSPCRMCSSPRSRTRTARLGRDIRRHRT